MEHEGSLPYSLETTAVPYPTPVLKLLFYLFKINLMLLFHLRLISQAVSSLLVFRLKFRIYLSRACYNTHPTQFFLILSY